MFSAKDRVILVVGALAVLLITAGVIAIGSREGAREHAIEPHAHPIVVSGTYATQSASGTPGPGDQCIPELPATECTSARFAIEVRVEGLPALDSVHYLAFLTAGDHTMRLGPLAPQGSAFVLQHSQASELQGEHRLIVSLHNDTSADQPGPLQVYTRTIDPDAQPGGALDDETTFTLAGTGTARTSQTGAVTVSALVEASLRDLPDATGWTMHAWLVDESTTPVYTYLDAIDVNEDGTGTLDVRRERVHVEDQDVFLVTLTPHGELPGAEPQGLLAYTATLR